MPSLLRVYVPAVVYVERLRLITLHVLNFDRDIRYGQIGSGKNGIDPFLVLNDEPIDDL
ncbi:hypothetical protein [Paenibacillus sp. JCM 10914]|uniref:hypothetical protein n=1 Tax=Paenibacillus sp. JCM 10914 TaxID=1236974 RepID=UPI0003CC591B|nr:hypothetical protein [Paenibacillus sp. JCM 10914]GAE06556.1 hypothetical protein JCM10914_2721 [Paenibacillus sp. JCM 10914]